MIYRDIINSNVIYDTLHLAMAWRAGVGLTNDTWGNNFLDYTVRSTELRYQVGRLGWTLGCTFPNEKWVWLCNNNQLLGHSLCSLLHPPYCQHHFSQIITSIVLYHILLSFQFI